MQLDLSWVDLLELSHDLLGAIWGVIIDYNYLHVDFTIEVMVSLKITYCSSEVCIRSHMIKGRFSLSL
jgi:hypothetical protein